MPLFKINQGSVLVFSLIILSIILSAAITVATVSVTNQRSATATGKSVQSFQVADSGIELALQKIYKGTYTSSDSLATAMTGMTCSGTTLTKSDVAGGNVSLTLFDNSNNPINCSDTSWRDKVVKVKSEGSAFGTTRVVETAVAAGGLSCVNKTVSLPDNTGGSLTSNCDPGFIAVSCLDFKDAGGDRICSTSLSGSQCTSATCVSPGVGEHWTLIATCCKV